MNPIRLSLLSILFFIGSFQLAFAAEGDSWPLFRGNATATGVAASKLPEDLDVLWKFTVDKGAFEATAVIGDGLVFLGDLDNRFYALDLRDGKKLWEFKAAAGISAAAAYRPGRDRSGDLASAHPEPRPTPRPPAVENGRVYFGDVEGGFYCLDAKTGRKLWTFASEGEIDSAPNFYKNLVLFGSQDATLYALDAADGKVAWKHTIDDQIRCSPTIVEDRCFLAGCDGKLHVIELNKGEEVGSVPIEAPTGSTPAAMGKLVYFGTEGAEFFAVDWKAATVAWKYTDTKHSQPFRSSAAAAPDMVIVGGRDKLVHCFAPADGKELWAFPTKHRVDSSPVIVGDRVFFGSADGRIYALNRQTGKEVWKYEAGGDIAASPAVAAERLVISSGDGTVYCFGAKK